MKLTYALILAAAASGLASAQTTAYTTPVGYVTVPIPGKVGTVNGLQLASQQLLPSGATQFASVATSIVGHTLTDSTAAWTTNAFVSATTPTGFTNHSCLVEVTSGALAGTMTWVTANDATTITTYDDISAAGAASYRVIKAFTISTLLAGAADAAPPSTVLGGGTSTTADNLLLFNSPNGVYTTFYYKTSGAGGTGWRSTGSTSVNVASVAIHPVDSGLLIVRKQSGAGSLVISGDVKTGVSDVVIRGGGGTGPSTTSLNIIQTPIPVDQITLGGSGLYTGVSTTGVLGGTSTTADSVLTYDGTSGVYTTYYYKTSGAGGTGWRSTASTSADRSTTVLPSGSAILIQRKSSGTDFTWKIPAANIAQ